ncbi:hypothetical protein [Nocardia jejuensis]|uniref:hypothetical protein n=1 Tax=Nocardia jejuensis TaxID=328049 RepID=UPI00083556E3|nr:hypothetical protein [Nocardia jejuensis]
MTAPAYGEFDRVRRPARDGTSIRGAATYTGRQRHCTHWRDEEDLLGLHVAVVGPAAAIARVLPGVASQARRVTVFQHDPMWVLPWPAIPGVRELLRRCPEDLLGLLPANSAPPLPGEAAARAADRVVPQLLPDLRESSRDATDTVPAAVSALPGGGALWRLGGAIARRLGDTALRQAATANLRVQVRDPWQRRKLTPDTATGVRLHNHYYRALERRNCRLVTWPIARIAPLGVRTVDGIEHRVDCIIYAEEMF